MVATARAFARRELGPKQELRFLEKIRLANGTFKTTAFGRLDDLNQMVSTCWKQLGASPRAILDVAVSSGITSKEWIDQLLGEGFDVHLTATDLTLSAHLVALGPGLEVLLDGSGNVLQYSLLGLALPERRHWFEYLSGAGIVKRIADQLIRAKGRKTLIESSLEEVMLVNAGALNHPRITFVEDDIFARSAPDSVAGRFDALRAANILNFVYFGRDEIICAISNLRQRLSGPGAFLIVVRTQADGTNHGSMFRLNADKKFEVVLRIGNGSEIEELVLSGTA